ncbi:unnamed protein product [Penicillium camemberti]|uniref:Str. FM013 n=1 Tax=Penicillium camemberti (strain FM 013) TaxID=1429867 RepID=A0A0G4NXM0_PENC3|nr:unnamed protein product [Penicillium camemberti]
MAVYGTTRRQQLPATELVLEQRAKAQAKRKADPHHVLRANHASKVFKARAKLNKRRCIKFGFTKPQIEEAWLALWERQIERFDWQVSIRQTRIAYMPNAGHRKAVTDWIANGRRETPTVDVSEWDEMCRATALDNA